MKCLKLLFVALFFVACSDDGFVFFELQACNTDNALTELDWLRQEIQKRSKDFSEDAKYCYITMASARGQTVFLYKDCNPLIDKVIPIFDCQGNELGFLGDEDFQFKVIEDERIIFSPPNFACQL